MSEAQRFSIGGMMCAGCVTAVESAIQAVPGVNEVLVNLGERTANVSGDAKTEAIVSAVKTAGFEAAELRSLADEYAKDERELQHTRVLWWRAIIAGGLGALLMLASHLGFLPTLAQNQRFWLGISVLTLLVLVFVGGHFFVGAYQSLRAGRGNMDTLIALGTGTAWLYSTAVVLFPEAVPSIARYVYFEAAIFIVGLVSLGAALEARARGKTSAAIKRLVGLQPSVALAIRNGVEVEVPIEDVGLDETLRVKPGDRIPVDGSVIDGESYVDEAMLTGEPMPVLKAAEAAVFGGTINKQGSFLMKATKIGADTALARIVELVRRAQSSKPAIGRLVDQVAAVFVPIVVGIATLSFVLWYWLGPEPKLAYALVAAMTVLVIACPCALGLATPISIMVGVGRAADNGILIRNGEALQTASKVNVVVLDKTGTVTEGTPSLSATHAFGDKSAEDLLTIAAAIESHSEHPIADAITQAAKQQSLLLPNSGAFLAVPGLGASGQVNGENILLGNDVLMRDHQIALPESAAELVADDPTATPVFMAIDQVFAGLFLVKDSVRENAKDAIARLHNHGLQTLLLTGDNLATANAVAATVGINQVRANVLPADKEAVIRELQAQGKTVAMVGDGINDAPALARADVGIAIGTGTDVAIEAADIALMRASLEGVADTLMLSKATIGNIKQNLFGAFVYNVLGIPVAAGLLYPLTGTLLSPVFAAAAMSLSSVTVVSNALRLRKVALA